MEDSQITTLTFLTDREVISIHDQLVTFTPKFISDVIIPSHLNFDTILESSTLFLTPLPEDSLPNYLAIISALLTSYGIENVDEQMDLFF